MAAHALLDNFVQSRIRYRANKDVFGGRHVSATGYEAPRPIDRNLFPIPQAGCAVRRRHHGGKRELASDNRRVRQHAAGVGDDRARAPKDHHPRGRRRRTHQDLTRAQSV